MEPRQPVNYGSMETFVDVSEIRLVGGASILDLANTQSGPPGGSPDIESFGDFGDVLRWGVRAGVLEDSAAERLAGLAAVHPRAAAAAFQRVVALRHDAYAVFSALAGGVAPPDGPLRQLHAAAAESLAHGTVAPDDAAFSMRWTQTDDPDRAWWAVAYGGLELLLHGPLDRIKGCGGCRYLFLDETKNRSRRWCSMEDCGTREKMKTYVARRAERRRAR
jgi:predicted RNA-binding Zn ribbon-like protein